MTKEGFTLLQLHRLALLRGSEAHATCNVPWPTPLTPLPSPSPGAALAGERRGAGPSSSHQPGGLGTSPQQNLPLSRGASQAPASADSSLIGVGVSPRRTSRCDFRAGKLMRVACVGSPRPGMSSAWARSSLWPHPRSRRPARGPVPSPIPPMALASADKDPETGHPGPPSCWGNREWGSGKGLTPTRLQHQQAATFRGASLPPGVWGQNRSLEFITAHLQATLTPQAAAGWLKGQRKMFHLKEKK